MKIPTRVICLIIGMCCAPLMAASDLVAQPAPQTESRVDLNRNDGIPEKPRTLLEYVGQEKDFFAYLREHHPMFKYEAAGRLVGQYSISDRQEEFVDFGGGDKYAAKQGRPTAITYRLGFESVLDFPNKYVGPEKCAECHPAQYQAWERSRHAKTVRFPSEMVEIPDGDLNRGLYGSKASVLPEGITADAIYAVIGTPRTKYGFIDGWMVRGTYHIEGGLLRDGTGTMVAGGNQFSRGWAQFITPDMARKIARFVPGFPTKLEDFGSQGSSVWGMTSYGASNRTRMLFQPASAYCEVCHTMKFDFNSSEEFIAALGKPEELRKHTIAKGISCEECHGAGAHLYGARGTGIPSNCERCHQRFAYNEADAEANPLKPFNAYFKSSCPSCGTEGSQMYSTVHYEKGMRCSTCHDPHAVTANDWKEGFTKTTLKKQCQDCHTDQAQFFAQGDTHGQSSCTACHMPNMGSCENFATIQFPDMAGFDNVRRAHIWKIRVDETAKTLNPPEGKPRTADIKGWTIAKQDGKPYLDLMWSCGRTSFSDGDVVEGGGCHSPVQTVLSERLQFKDQESIYAKVMEWQTPVRDGYVRIRSGLTRIEKRLAKAPALALSDQVQIRLLSGQARAQADLIEKDGSWGLHAPNYAKTRMEEALLYIEQAETILSGGKTPK
ncbi:cytochrome c3 family protein [Edwardsiella piscicida]|nr:cytochrome c3 family protein [Edwardsiella piscicida]MDM3865991.1 cytochrome C [Edwardsiella piscicida]UCQ14493.1 cytochrome C [Edwardsiella piscicida]UCQ37681.1 cytochrome C [Edwardsiella piscicida]UCQ40973.1 cytochrome C [Edwardsiella piscicida]UJT82302.1 cytochrome C [Edwardsiella piscicida]